MPAFPAPTFPLLPNSWAYEIQPLVKPTGFREYDARWLFGTELNLMGVQALGMGLGTLLGELGISRQIVTGHDFRSYSASIKLALVSGLMATGCTVHDIGLAITPMAYFAQFHLDLPAVAMVTASHNENGWTGVKMGAARPLTFGPDEMRRLKEIVLSARFDLSGGGSYIFHPAIADKYISDLTQRAPFSRHLKVVVACGNGTAGAFAPRILSALGADVIQVDCTLDYKFPKYNPNPEDMKMLRVIRNSVIEHRADIGLGFDGDGDRCGVIDNEGEEIFADKVGVLLARDISKKYKHAKFVVDVKSTCLYEMDPVLSDLDANVYYWKTGHSYIKRRVHEIGAQAGFEKSGHYFFNPPIGRGYDDGIISAISILDMLCHNPDLSMADLKRSLPKTWGSPTMSPACPDECKYQVVAAVTDRFRALQAKGELIAGQRIAELVTINGVRVVMEDGTWALVRASSNTPQLVVVVESPVSEARLRNMFSAVDTILRESPEVGPYNQTL
ncbi:phosphomannomutase/phosphoglucomutase (plasmid) [Segnochrobactraceae bacterium EtOH-i3]